MRNIHDHRTKVECVQGGVFQVVCKRCGAVGSQQRDARDAHLMADVHSQLTATIKSC